MPGIEKALNQCKFGTVNSEPLKTKGKVMVLVIKLKRHFDALKVVIYESSYPIILGAISYILLQLHRTFGDEQGTKLSK